MRRFIFQTFRPISFVSWIPAFVGSLLAHNFGWHVLTTSLGVVASVGLTNAFNNVVDRRIDSLNPLKDTLAVIRPVSALIVVLVVSPFLALLLRETGYDYRLLSVLFYGGVFYNLALGRVRIVKRLVVATIVSATSVLAASSYPPLLLAWAGLVWCYIYQRETKKDNDDFAEDNMRRFLSFRQLTVDWWFALAPLVGVTAYLAGVWANGATPDSSDLVIAMGIALTIISYAVIRSRNGWYKVKLHGNVLVGVAGLSLALSGLMPPFANGAVKILVIFNLATIFVRAISLRSVDLKPIAGFHDAWLWASLFVLVMARYQSLSASCSVLTALVLGLVFFREARRLKVCRLSPAP